VTVRGADGSVERRFTTFVDVTAGHVGNPVRVAFIAPLNPSGPHPVTNASEVLTALGRHSAVPVTIALEPSLLDLSARRRGPLAGQVRSSLQQGRALLATTYAPIDPTALFAAGLGAEVARQRDIGRTTLAQVGLASTTPLTPSFVGAATLPSAFDLHRVGAQTVIVSGSQLRVDPATTTGWGQPFNVASGVGSIRAVATDDRLTKLLSRATTDPVLVANQILAVLAFRYREAPGLTTPRGVVLTPTVGTQVPAALVDALLRGLASAPELRPVTLATFLETVPVGGNGSATVRFSAALSRPTTRVLANNVTTARSTWTSFAPFLSAAPRRYAQIDHQILAAQSLALKTATAVARVTSVRAHFEALTRAVRVSTSSFTLTSQQGTVPLTIASTAKTPLVVHVDLTSDRVSFPGGEHFNVTITQAATTVRIPVVAATTGVLPMRISVTAPGTNVEVAGASITVQVAATSIVGKALTLGAILVLLWWWFTTWRRSRREAADEASLHD
jgi:hypothetical protein